MSAEYELQPKRKREPCYASSDPDSDFEEQTVPEPGSHRKRARLQHELDNDDATSGYAISTLTSLAGVTYPTATVAESATLCTETSSVHSKSKPRAKKYHCTFPGCDKAYNRPIHLQTHINSHTGARPHVCTFDECDKSFTKVDHLNRHIRDKHGQHEVQTCNYIIHDDVKGEPGACGKTFPTIEKLKRHIARHEEKEETRCSWDNCGKVFRKQETLQRHIRKDHLKELPFVCTRDTADGEKCAQAFGTASLLQGHINREHEAPRYICNLCSGPPAHVVMDLGNELDPEFLPTSDDTQLEDEDVDANILRTLTLEESAPIGVQYPGGAVGFATFNELSHHLKVAHPPTCADCGKQCKSARDLTAHIDIHHPTEGSAERRAAKSVPCPYEGCPRADPGNGFTSKGNMQTHVKSVHRLERKFICGDFDLASNAQVAGWDGQGCGMGLVNKSSLISHIRTQHLGLAGPDKKRFRKSKTKQEGGDDAMNTDVMEPSTSAALSLVTGAGYEERRPIPCLLAASQGCQMRFMRDYDLGVHMELTHGWQVDDVDEAIAISKGDTAGVHGLHGQDMLGMGMGEIYPVSSSGMCVDPSLEASVA